MKINCFLFFDCQYDFFFFIKKERTVLENNYQTMPYFPSGKTTMAKHWFKLLFHKKKKKKNSLM